MIYLNLAVQQFGPRFCWSRLGSLSWLCPPGGWLSRGWSEPNTWAVGRTRRCQGSPARGCKSLSDLHGGGRSWKAGSGHWEILPGLACHFQHILFYLVKQVARPARIPGVGKKPTSDGRSCRELAALCSILSTAPFATVVSTVPPSRGHSPSPRPPPFSPQGGTLPTLGCSLLGCI